MNSAIDEWLRLGFAHHRARQFKEAAQFYERALALDGQNPDALHLSGLLALESEEFARALELLQQASRLQPRNWTFRAHLALALFQLKQYDQALTSYGAAAKLNPHEPQLQIAGANCSALLGNFEYAESQLRKIVRRFPGNSSAWFNLGNAVRDQGRLDEAAALFTRATQFDPQHADAYNNLGGALHALERFDIAETAYRRACALRPDDMIARCNLASVLVDMGKFTDAESVSREALKIDPGFISAHSTLAAALSGQGRLIDALPVYRSAAELSPEDPRMLVAYGSALFEAGQTADGIALLERVVQTKPGSTAAHQALAWAYLSIADFRAGWREYLYRPRRDRFVAKHASVTLTTELPAGLDNKTVCLLREQGLGDELFFARYARRLSARGARVFYSADARLVAMLRRTELFESVLPQDGAIPPSDFYVLLGDLPLALGANEISPISTTETPRPLELPPLAELVEELRTKLAILGPPPYFGITWRAGIAPEEQRGATWAFFKAIPLPAIARALRDVPGTVLVLQRAPRPGEVDEFSHHLERPAYDLSELNGDLEAMLALLSLIDDYIGVSNTNMHLRAGVGRGARVLVPCPAEWRWMAAVDRSPWFPQFRAYRQGKNGDWSEALDRLLDDLQNQCATDDAHVEQYSASASPPLNHRGRSQT